MEFKKPSLSDRKLIQGYIDKSHAMGCEFSFANMLLWSDYYEATFAQINDTLVFKTDVADNCFRVSFPIGDGDKKKTIQDMIDYCKQNSMPLEIKGVTIEDRAFLDEHFADKFDLIEDRDSYDYIYNSSDLISLKGKKYHGKRNHVNRFIKENEFTYETVTKDNTDSCLDMLKKWHDMNVDEDSTESKKAEILVVEKMCELFEQLGLVGGLIKIDGEVQAFTLGERLNEDTFVVHIEKAFANINGCYTMINQQFCEHELGEYRYINREEDLGIDGLRKSKLSYYPEILLQKDIARLK